jgi:hypothetical protein
MEEVRVDQHHVGDWITSTKNKYETKWEMIAQQVEEEIPSENNYSEEFEE